MGTALGATADFSAGWGARPPVAGAVYDMQIDLFVLAARIEAAFAEDGGTHSPGQGWELPADYPLTPLAARWDDIPTFEAVTLPGLFRATGREAALDYFADSGVCSFATAFSAAVDAAVELSAA